MKKHGKDKRRIWRKLHIAVDADTHQIVAAELSLSNVAYGEVLPGVLKKTDQKIKTISGDEAYDSHRWYQAIMSKKAKALITPRIGATYWEDGHTRNYAVASQRIHGCNHHWKSTSDYLSRSIFETGMSRYKKLITPSLSMREYDAQVAESYAGIRALNKLTRLGMPETRRAD